MIRRKHIYSLILIILELNWPSQSILSIKTAITLLNSSTKECLCQQKKSTKECNRFMLRWETRRNFKHWSDLFFELIGSYFPCILAPHHSLLTRKRDISLQGLTNSSKNYNYGCFSSGPLQSRWTALLRKEWPKLEG